LEEKVGTAEQIDGQARQTEIRHEPADEHVNDLDGEDREAPEDEKVHPAGWLVAWQRLLADDELLLSKDELADRVDAVRNPIEAGDRRDLQEHRKAPVERAAEDAQRDHEHGGKY